jgi:uncharacterized protein
VTSPVQTTARAVLESYLAALDRAVLEWKVRGTAAATGKPYDNDYCGIFIVRAGRIAEVREYLDTLHAADVLFEP